MKVLVIEDAEFVRRHYVKAFPAGTVVLEAETISQARELFQENPDIDAMIVDGCVPGDNLNTLGLIREFRAAGFSGLMIAASSMPDFRTKMVNAGCDGEYEKSELVEAIPSLFAETATSDTE